MSETPTAAANDLDRAFDQYEQPIRVQNAKICCIVAGIFMPAGFVLDYYVYGREIMLSFLPYRILCSVLLGVLWVALHYCPIGRRRCYRILGHLVALLPLLCISWMIYTT